MAMSSGILWVSSLMLILMQTMIACAKIKNFILFTDADDKSTRYVPLGSNSSAPITLFKHLGNQNPIAVDYDYVEDRVYWSDNDQGRIISAFFNVTSVKILFYCNVNNPEGLAIDYVGRNIYWTDAGINRIEVGLLDGTGRKLLIKDGLDRPRAIVLHLKNSMMYWTDWGAIPKIERAGMDGSARQTIVTGNLVWPNGLTIDLATDYLYWADAKLDNIEKSDLNGGNRQRIASSAADIHPYGLAVFENVLYWTDWNAKSISRFNLTSGNHQIIVNGLQKPMDIHVFDPALIFSGYHPCAQNNGPCSDLCLLKPGGNGAYQCACPTGIQLKADGKSCDYGLFYKITSDQFMIFAEADKGEIYKVPLGIPETPCYPLGINTNISRPVAVDYDPVEGKIYWTDVKLKLLARAFPNGTSVEVIAHSNVVIPNGLAVDRVARNIYWTDEGNNRIEVARLDGSSRRSLIKTNIEKPRAILLDIGERKMYWSGRTASGKIEQANIDGSGRKALINYGAMWVNSLAMDYQNRLLYWCDAFLHKIERVDLQGNNREVILDLSSDSLQPFGLALFGDVVYWSDWKSKSVHKYNMKTSVQSVVVSGMGKPMELHIYDRSEDLAAATCPALLAPSNGIRQGCTGTRTESYNTVCEFSCNTGFNAVGSLSRKCLENGNWSGQDFLCQETKHTSLTVKTAIALGSSLGGIILILVGLGLWKRHFLSGRRLQHTPKENVGVNNKGYVNKDDNPNSVAGTEELDQSGSRRSSAAHDQTNAVSRTSSDTGGAAGCSNSALTDEGGSGEGPVRDEHILRIHELVGVNWKKVLRNLSMPEIIIRNLEEDNKHSEVAEKCQQALLKWKEMLGPQGATIQNLCQVLQNVGCTEALEALRSM